MSVKYGIIRLNNCCCNLIKINLAFGLTFKIKSAAWKFIPKAEMVHDFIWVPAISILVMGSITVGVTGQITVMEFAHKMVSFILP